MKIIETRVNMTTGKIEEEEQKVKIPHFTEGEAAGFFRQYLLEKGYKDKIGTALIDRKKYGQLQYLSLFGKPIRCKFVLWQAQKDTETGKAVFWIGERNSAKLIEVEYGTIIHDRIIPTDVHWYCLIVAPRSFRVGNSLKDAKFVDFLLMPIEDIIIEIEKTKNPYIDIRKSHRKDYSFENMIDILKNREEKI